MHRRRILVAVGSRANYASIHSVRAAIQAHPALELRTVAYASALLDKYGAVADTMDAEFRVSMVVDGDTPAAMAGSVGVGLLKFPEVFARLNPDVVLVVGDRYEILAPAIAASLMNIPLAHTMGGEVSGTIDESVRHAVTKLASLHFPATREAALRIVRLGEREEHVHVVGCPRMDLAALATPLTSAIYKDGVGTPFHLAEPFLMVSQHPVTTEYGDAETQMLLTLAAVRSVGMPAAIFWPNPDAGTDGTSRAIRLMRGKDDGWMYCFKNLPPADYLALMRKTVCLVGNSSSAIREGAFLGTPAVNIGSRQKGRERAANVVDAPHRYESILEAMREQISHGRFPCSQLYGDGHAGVRIADILATCELSVQKRITY